MKNTGLIIFKITRTVVAFGVLLIAFAIIDGSFFRGFGDDELIISCIFYALFMPSLLYTLGYIAVKKLPSAVETDSEPLWFKRVFTGSLMYPLLIIAVGIFNSFTGVLSFFGSRDFIENFIFGAAAALAFLLIVPVIPAANMMIIIYLYRKNIRKKKYTSQGQR